MCKPKFSIIIPAYNRSETIDDTLNSVLQQTFQNYECIVVDDGSNDSAQLEHKVAQLGDQRFKYVWRENGGGGAARNTGVDHAIGDFIAFLDSDDLFLPEKLDKLNNFSGLNDDTVVYSYMRVDRGVGKDWIRPDRPIHENEDVGEYLFVSNQFIQTSTIVLSRNTALRVRFDDNLRKGQDLDFCIQLDKAGLRFEMYEEPLTIWVDISEGNRTSRVKGYKAPAEWLKHNKSNLTTKAYLGYQSTVLAYYIGWSKPFTACTYLAKGYLFAGVPLLITLRQLLRTFMPSQLYRSLIGTFVFLRGRKPE